jgi:hypothetical protein
MSLQINKYSELDKFVQYIDEAEIDQMSMQQFYELTNFTAKQYSMYILIKKHKFKKALIYAKQANTLQLFFYVYNKMKRNEFVLKSKGA